jgi:hypothetical protein
VVGASLRRRSTCILGQLRGIGVWGPALGKGEWRVTHPDFLVTKLEHTIKVLSRPSILKYHISFLLAL